MKNYNFAQITILVFGVLTAIMGIAGLFTPWLLLKILDLNFDLTQTRTFLMASSEASLAMGVYYILAAITNNRTFFIATVFVRIVNTIVFSMMVVLKLAPVGWLMVAVYEGSGALLTGVALWKSTVQKRTIIG